MKNIPAILFFFFFPASLFAQHTIKGRVINAANGAAIAGCSIFITNTSKGTVSDNNGYFDLTDIPRGKQELVISSIGYSTNVFSFSESDLPLTLKIELEMKAKELSNVTIEPSVEEGWDKWGRTFMDYFVGNSETASRCRIKNEQAIKFRLYKKSNRLVAFCEEPVLLENKALGYLVKYQLEEFEINFKNQFFFFLGYSLYEPLGKVGKAQLKRWEEKREISYNGSIMHFMTSLYNGRILEEGFEVRRMVRTPNFEKERVKELQRKRQITSASKQGSEDEKIVFSRDSLEYFQKVMRQQDYFDTYGNSLLSADSLLTGSKGDNKILQFDDYIYVTYKNETEEAGYLSLQYPPRKAGFQQSYVTLLNDKLITIARNGAYYNPSEFLSAAYWSWSEKMSNALPLDYQKNKK